jgi:hypothetical protein
MQVEKPEYVYEEEADHNVELVGDLQLGRTKGAPHSTTMRFG